ncbi:MAG TPA: hypothetical protein DEP18_07600 [Flavobacteriales bacterium]|nr:hypothetical protein [Flavobacteriales bacterium]HRE74440.1 VWA domain-containing protein [Flavobacteriales bacterium]HRE97419.1 VWA domain-containing protein [Flavobacteriales bacterium]HRJ35644.1 VWA domain-containing protein [Flavobacteriales bacterium]HRJ38921.1 VWA domain-containing protein [Flavobacteriales bacterium]
MNNASTYRVRTLVVLVLISELLFWSAAISLWLYLQTNVEEFRMENVELLQLLYGLPVLGLSFLLFARWKNNALKRFAEHSLINRIDPGSSTSKSFLRFFLFRSAMAMFIIALANPQYGKTKKEAVASGIDLMIALDVSNSMLAEDMNAEMNRLRVARLSIEKLLGKLHGDRIGLVVFAGASYTQLPITTDYSAARLFLSGVSTNMMSSQGTAIGSAIDTCMRAFNSEDETKKAIIVISDGENHEDDAIGSAKRAESEGVIVHTIGVGSPEGSPIPVYENGQKTGVKRDNEGNTVITKLNEAMLTEIANAGGGSYTRASGSDLGLDRVVRSISSMEKKEYLAEMYTDYEDQFQIFIGLGLLLLVLESLITEKPNPWLRRLYSQA